MSTCGYVIDAGAVAFLERDFSRPEDAIIVDDIRNTGESANETLRFWKELDPKINEPELVILQEVNQSKK